MTKIYGIKRAFAFCLFRDTLASFVFNTSRLIHLDLLQSNRESEVKRFHLCLLFVSFFLSRVNNILAFISRDFSKSSLEYKDKIVEFKFHTSRENLIVSRHRPQPAGLDISSFDFTIRLFYFRLK